MRKPDVASIQARSNWTPPAFIDAALAGTVAIDPAGPFTAGSIERLTLTYTAGRFGIDDTGTLRVCFRFATDGGPPQFDDPRAVNFVSVEASNAAVLDVRYDYKLNTRPWDRTIVVRVVRGYLREGDTITLRFGDACGGSPGFRFQTFVDPFHQFQVLVDPIATGSFVRVAEQPTFAIVAGPPASWHAMAPTLRRIGERFDLGLRVDDRWGNPSSPGDVSVHLEADGPLDGLPATMVFPTRATSLRVSGLSLKSAGEARITVRDEKGIVLCRSNPILARSYHGLISCWGDLHAQSAETIGTRSLEDYCDFARDQAFLDAISHQGNDFQITAEFWGELNDVMAALDDPGRFIAISGYEWSGNTTLGGDRNVFFRQEGRPIRRSSHALVADLSDLESDCHDARALFSALTRDKEDVVCWAHCGGRYADIGYAHDVALERSIEIHSSWGTFEWLLNDAFALGYRVGVVANSDGHKGRPGSEAPGASQFGAIGGLTCFLVPDLTRDALFAALRSRHHYGTTGCRLHLDVRAELPTESEIFADDPTLPDSPSVRRRVARMGDIVRGGAGEVRLSVEVAAANPISVIEIRNGTRILETIRPGAESPNGHRFLASWSGAEYRGRFRQTKWDGQLSVTDNSIEAITAINFFNPDQQPQILNVNTVSWRSTTTGNFAGVEVTLADGDAGMMRLESPNGTLTCSVAKIGLEPVTLACGKLDRELKLTRLPDLNSNLNAKASVTLRVEPGSESPLFVAVTLEDGHRAWSSPIYIQAHA